MKKIVLMVFFTIALSQQSCNVLRPYCVNGPFQPDTFVVTSLAFDRLYPYAYMVNDQYYCGCDQSIPFSYSNRWPNYWVIRNRIQTQGYAIVYRHFDPWWGGYVLSY